MIRCLLIFLALLQVTWGQYRTSNCVEEVARCRKLVQPLLTDLQYAFPIRIDDINSACRRWQDLVSCMNGLEDACMTASTKQEYDQAIRDSVDNMHRICKDNHYRDDVYLKHAPCVQRVLTGRTAGCKQQYDYLIERVSDIRNTSSLRAQICCSAEKFRSCMMEMSEELCGQDDAGFIDDLLEKALNIFHDRCRNYVSNSGDCTEAGDHRIYLNDRRRTDYDDHRREEEEEDRYNSNYNPNSNRYNNNFNPSLSGGQQGDRRYDDRRPGTYYTSTESWYLDNNNVYDSPHQQQYTGNSSGYSGATFVGLLMSMFVAVLL